MPANPLSVNFAQYKCFIFRDRIRNEGPNSILSCRAETAMPKGHMLYSVLEGQSCTLRLGKETLVQSYLHCPKVRERLKGNSCITVALGLEGWIGLGPEDLN